MLTTTGLRPTLVSLAALVFLAGCGAQKLPAPNPPAKEIPKDVDVPDEPPPNGAGRVLLDANGDKAKVVEITGSATAAAGNYRATIIGVRPLCTTPCVVDLPYGSHPLVFKSTTDESRMSEVDLDVGPKPKVVRHTLGERKDGGALHSVGSSILVLGAITALTGGILWATGALTSRDGKESSITPTGQLITGIGAAGIGISIPLLIVGRPTERPGATTEWSVSPEPTHKTALPPARGVVNSL